jgi:hypothetical protein
MEKVALYELYQFGKMMRFFERLTPQTTFLEIRNDCELASMWFGWLLKQQIAADCPQPQIQQLKAICDQFMAANSSDALGDKRHEIVAHFFLRFEHVFEAELARSDVYFVKAVGGYSTEKLLWNPRSLLHESSLAWISEGAIQDFEEGVQSLALGQATASGFQLLRSVEAMMHQYYDVVSNRAERPANRNVGIYIASLERVPGIDGRMLEVLRGIKNLRRNPLAHPDEFLEIGDALITLDISRSSISTMAQLAKEHAERAGTKYDRGI